MGLLRAPKQRPEYGPARAIGASVVAYQSTVQPPGHWPEYGEAWVIHGMRVIYSGCNPATVMHWKVDDGATMQVTVSTWKRWRLHRIANRARA